jgi:O-antigen/teichoic acid export membrane protein
MPSLFESFSLSSIRSWLSERHGRELLTVFFIQVFSLLASLAISLIITNLLGAAAYGIYSYGFSWVNLLAVFSCMGFEQLALKELPVYRVQGNQSFIRGYFIYSVRRILVTSIIASISLFIISFAFTQPKDHDLRIGLWLSIPILPVVALLNLRFSWLRSFQFNSLSQLPG